MTDPLPVSASDVAYALAILEEAGWTVRRITGHGHVTETVGGHPTFKVTYNGEGAAHTRTIVTTGWIPDD